MHASTLCADKGTCWKEHSKVRCEGCLSFAALRLPNMTPAAVVLLHNSLPISNLSCKEDNVLRRNCTGLRMRRLRLPLTSGWQDAALRLLLI